MSSYSARQVNLLVFTSQLEVPAVSVQGDQRNALVVVLYWPGFAEISNAFFEESMTSLNGLRHSHAIGKYEWREH